MNLALIFRTHTWWTTGYCFKAALEAMGVPFTHFDNNDLFANRRSLAGFDAAIQIDDGFGLQHTPNLPMNSTFYAIDLHNNYIEHYQANIGQFRRLYCAQRTLGVELLKQHGIASQWLPPAFDDVRTIVIPNAEPEYPVSFFASWSTDRRKQLKRIIEERYHGFTSIAFIEKRPPDYPDDMGTVFSHSTVLWNDFGLQTNGTAAGNHVNLRVFECLGNGRLLLTPRMDAGYDDLDMLGLYDGVHLVLWDSVGDLLEKTDYYLAHAEERERIAAAGRAWVMAGHTYKHRVAKILEDLEG